MSYLLCVLESFPQTRRAAKTKSEIGVLAAVALSIGFLSIRPLIKPPVHDLCAGITSRWATG